MPALTSVLALDQTYFKWTIKVRTGVDGDGKPVLGELEGRGLLFDHLAYLQETYPEFKQLAGDDTDVTPETIMSLSTPQIVGQLVACGTRASPEDWIAVVNFVAEFWSADEHLQAVTKIFDATFPEGWRPFVKRLEYLRTRIPLSTLDSSRKASPNSSVNASGGELQSSVLSDAGSSPPASSPPTLSTESASGEPATPSL